MASDQWSWKDCGTYAVLLRPDGTIAGRIHVIAEAEQIAKWINEAMEREMGK